MPFSELFSSSFLFSIGIVVVLIGLVFAYMSYRMSEQDHKISSMVSLVSTMAEELQFFRNKLSSTNYSHSTHQINPLYNTPNFEGGANHLIEVSDGDEDEDDSSENDVNDDDETCSGSGDDAETEQETEQSENEESDEESDEDDNIKSIHLDEEPFHELDNEVLRHSLDSDIIDLSRLPIPHIDEEKQEENDNDKDNIVLSNDNLKSISITEDIHEEYKKMSLPKLRSIVLEKGLASDASKLKKSDILKLLEE